MSSRSLMPFLITRIKGRIQYFFMLTLTLDIFYVIALKFIPHVDFADIAQISSSMGANWALFIYFDARLKEKETDIVFIL